MNKITFFLMTYKGYASLKSFIEAFGTANIDFVVVSKDANVQNDYYNDIISLCEENNIKWFKRNDEYTVTSAYAFAISWRWLIKTNSTMLIVFHDSLLPKYRGFAPLVTALVNGDDEVGVTALLASEEYDRGAIIAQEKIKINYPVKIIDAIDNISVCYTNLVTSISKKIFDGKGIEPVAQIESEASYSLWLDEKDYRIEWKKDAGFIKRFVDSVGYPFKGAEACVENRPVRILDTELVEDVNIPLRQPGKVIFVRNGKPVVVCGKGLLQINEMTDEDNQDLLPLKKFRTRFE